jgi:hypothetical protein
MSGFGYHDAERAALAFVVEDESWPVFLAWLRQNRYSGHLHDWLAAGPSQAGLQREWLEHSPDPEIKGLADVLYPES